MAGIVGYTGNSGNKTTNVEYCYNIGNIYGYKNVSGIISLYYGKQNIKNCYNTGKLVATKGTCGGIALGNGSSTVFVQCYNSGNIIIGSSRKRGGWNCSIWKSNGVL